MDTHTLLRAALAMAAGPLLACCQAIAQREADLVKVLPGAVTLVQ
ncbi:MAG: hypothetical protein ABI831_11275 [Betaproteobacteria bacterium]